MHDLDGHPLDDLILDAWRDLAVRVRFRRKGDKPDASLRAIAKDDAKLVSFVYFLCAEWTSSRDSAVAAASNAELAAMSGPASGKDYDAGQVGHVIVALKSALAVEDTGFARRGTTTYAIRFHCTEEDTHWFWFDLFRLDDGALTPLITNPDPMKSANKHNVVTVRGPEIIQRFLRIAPHIVVEQAVSARTPEVIEELLSEKRDVTVRQVAEAAPDDVVAVLLDENPQAIVDPIVARADAVGHGNEARSLFRKLGLHPVVAFVLSAGLALLVGTGVAYVAYAQSETFRKFVDDLIPGLKTPKEPPEKSSQRSGSDMTILAQPPPAGAIAQFIIHTPLLAQLVPTVTRNCANADTRARIAWEVPAGVPPPYVLLVNDSVVGEALSHADGKAVFDLPVDPGRTYTLKFGAYDAGRDHLYVSAGSEYTASCFDASTPPEYNVATTGTTDGVTATFLTPVAGAPAYFEPILRVTNAASTARTIVIGYDEPDPNGPAIVMELASGQEIVFEQLFRSAFGVRPSMSENVIRVMTSGADWKAVFGVAQLRYRPPRESGASRIDLRAADVAESPRVGDVVTPAQGSTRTRFVFRARPRILGNVRAVRYRWFFADCLARAVRRPLEELRYVDCYTPASSQPATSHVFAARGIYEVKLEAEFPTGEKTTERFCVLKIGKP